MISQSTAVDPAENTREPIMYIGGGLLVVILIVVVVVFLMRR
jgi:flagellar biogenesis protein FliO